MLCIAENDATSRCVPIYGSQLRDARIVSERRFSLSLSESITRNFSNICLLYYCLCVVQGNTLLTLLLVRPDGISGGGGPRGRQNVIVRTSLMYLQFLKRISAVADEWGSLGLDEPIISRLPSTC